MLDLSQAGTYDFVTCYSDSICYMQDEVEVGDVFKEVYNVLNEGGVFIFDVHSTYQTDEVFPGYSYHEKCGRLCHALGYLRGCSATFYSA